MTKRIKLITSVFLVFTMIFTSIGINFLGSTIVNAQETQEQFVMDEVYDQEINDSSVFNEVYQNENIDKQQKGILDKSLNLLAEPIEEKTVWLRVEGAKYTILPETKITVDKNATNLEILKKAQLTVTEKSDELKTIEGEESEWEAYVNGYTPTYKEDIPHDGDSIVWLHGNLIPRLTSGGQGSFIQSMEVSNNKVKAGQWFTVTVNGGKNRSMNDEYICYYDANQYDYKSINKEKVEPVRTTERISGDINKGIGKKEIRIDKPGKYYLLAQRYKQESGKGLNYDRIITRSKAVYIEVEETKNVEKYPMTLRVEGEDYTILPETKIEVREDATEKDIFDAAGLDAKWNENGKLTEIQGENLKWKTVRNGEFLSGIMYAKKGENRVYLPDGFDDIKVELEKSKVKAREPFIVKIKDYDKELYSSTVRICYYNADEYDYQGINTKKVKPIRTEYENKKEVTIKINKPGRYYVTAEQMNKDKVEIRAKAAFLEVEQSNEPLKDIHVKVRVEGKDYTILPETKIEVREDATEKDIFDAAGLDAKWNENGELIEVEGNYSENNEKWGMYHNNSRYINALRDGDSLTCLQLPMRSLLRVEVDKQKVEQGEEFTVTMKDDRYERIYVGATTTIYYYNASQYEYKGKNINKIKPIETKYTTCKRSDPAVKSGEKEAGKVKMKFDESGIYYVTAQAQNNGSRAKAALVQVGDVDIEKPIIEVEGIQDQATVDTQIISFKVMVEDNVDQNIRPVVKLNDEVLKEIEGKYEASLKEGANTIIIIAKDVAGNTEEKIYTINYKKEIKDITKPEISTDLGNKTVNEEKLTFKASAKDDIDGVVRIEVKLNGKVVEGKVGKYEVLLEEGENTIIITAKDKAGNTEEKTYTITYKKEIKDITKPEISTDLGNKTVNEEKLTFKASAEDDIDGVVGIEVRLNEKVVEGKVGKYEVLLKQGENTIIITAKDKAGNTEEKTYTIIYKKSKPSSGGSSSSSARSGGGSSLPSGTKVEKDKDSKVEKHNAVIEIPKGTVDENTYVKIEKQNDVSSLKLKDTEKIVGSVYEITKNKNKDFKKAITITLPFEKSKIDKDQENVSICYYDENNKRWVDLDNIKVDFEQGKVSGQVNHFTKFAVITKKIENEVIKESETKVEKTQEKVLFNDLVGYEWAKDAIEEMANKGITSGRSEGVFDPSASITRAEFATLITKMLGLKIENEKLSFTDIEDAAWYTPYVKTAYKNGLVSGRSEMIFDPNGKITREEMATIIGKVLVQKGKEKANTNELERFSDKTNIANWANENVSLCVKEKIISGMPDGTFMPKENANRAQAAVMLYNLYEAIQ